MNFLGIIISTIILYCFKSTVLATYLSVVFLTYIIIAIAFYKPLPFKTIGKYGDFSYGLYLYAFPVQQLIVHFSKAELSLFAMVMLSVFFTFPFAFLSWYLIEKPSINFKKLISKQVFR